MMGNSFIYAAHACDFPKSLEDIVASNLKGARKGIYSVCCTHPLVLEAAVDQAIADHALLLVEATANQVNQFGGYTGMTPAGFREYVSEIAAHRGLPPERLALGGDHLGPVVWAAEPAEVAMQKAEDLIIAFAEARFGKIHLDCSMPLQGDPPLLSDDLVAERAARLCARAEAAAIKRYGASEIVYVIGTEVPPPGGATEELAALEATPPEQAKKTLATHHRAFLAAGLDDAWKRVIALVVQPGVEFDNAAVVDFIPSRAEPLKQLAEAWGQSIAFEAHSTDYQLPEAFAALVDSHFAILKVGPALTFALREALFALSHIEDELIEVDKRSNIRQVCETQMVECPAYWRKFYHGESDNLRILRRYSYSDRIRYYWPDNAIKKSSDTLIANLDGIDIPEILISQYLPIQFGAIRRGELWPKPNALIRHKVREAIKPYADACQMGLPSPIPMDHA